MGGGTGNAKTTAPNGSLHACGTRELVRITSRSEITETSGSITTFLSTMDHSDRVLQNIVASTELFLLFRYGPSHSDHRRVCHGSKKKKHFTRSTLDGRLTIFMYTYHSLNYEWRMNKTRVTLAVDDVAFILSPDKPRWAFVDLS